MTDVIQCDVCGIIVENERGHFYAYGKSDHVTNEKQLCRPCTVAIEEYIVRLKSQAKAK